MDISLRWLRALAPDIAGDARALAERLASLGAPVESVEMLGAGLEDVVVGRVLEVGRHPNADRLSLCRVTDGTEEFQVVCGAPVIVEGALYPFARVGTSLPGGITLRKAKIRGEYSFGMLCSARELALGEDASGIMRLPDEAEPGVPLVEALALDDARLEVEVTANRGDLLSHIGVARELAPSGVSSIALPPVPGGEPVQIRYASGEREASGPDFALEVADPDLCPRYLGVVIRGVQVGPSPAWLQNRLRAVGARPINNVVDATNYVLLELGQPMHAFDLAKIGGGRVVVRRAAAGEPITTLDGETRELSASMLAICDAERPIAIAGVMGGADSEVDDDTRDILLECAWFDPPSTRATRRALGMSTDASYRFERGVDPDGMELAMRRAAEVVLATAGGTLAPAALAVGPGTAPNPRIELRSDRVESVLGVPFELEAMRGLLEPLGFGCTPTGEDSLTVDVPGARSRDVTREIDLIEEIARRWGYDRFPSRMAPFRPSAVPDDPVLALQDRLRDHLVARGLFEVQTPAFAPAGEGDVAIVNPVSAEEGVLRRALLPGVIRRVAHNFARGIRDVRLFETATVFAPGDPLPHEEIHLALVLAGHRDPPHWSGSAELMDLWDVRGLLEELGALVSPGTTVVGAERTEPSDPDHRWTKPFLPDAAFTLAGADGITLGCGGRLAADELDLPPWVDALWGIELALPSDPSPRSAPSYDPPPSLPGTARDLALIVPEAVSSAEVIAMIRDTGGAHLEAVEVFDRYSGERIPEGTTSVAFRLRFRARDRTLTDADVEGPMREVERRLREELDVRIRGG